MIKVAEIKPYGVANMTVYYDKTVKTNPYRVYLEWNEITDRGLVDHKKQVSRFADLGSAVGMMATYVLRNNEEGRG